MNSEVTCNCQYVAKSKQQHGGMKMALVDMPLEKLVVYKPELTQQPDFASFWAETRQQSDTQPLNAHITPVEYPVKQVRAFTVNYDGFGAGHIAAWYLLPRTPAPAAGYPVLVFYHGYSGNRGVISDYLGWILQGYAVVAVDVRGQGGESTDETNYPGPIRPGWMTRGITQPQLYYYRWVFMDCVRALDFVASQPELNKKHIILSGNSQGGALTLAVAALDERPIAAMPDVPFLCNFRRAVPMAVQPYQEIADYLKLKPFDEEQVYRTLSYFDQMNFAHQIQCPVLMSIALQDTICPPSTCFAAYNRIESDKEVRLYPYNNHEGGRNLQVEQKIGWLAKKGLSA